MSANVATHQAAKSPKFEIKALTRRTAKHLRTSRAPLRTVTFALDW